MNDEKLQKDIEIWEKFIECMIYMNKKISESIDKELK